MNADPLADYLRRHAANSRITLVGPFARHEVAPPEPVVFVDRGALYRRGGDGISIGDGDSYDGDLDVLLNPDKDYSDLAYVLTRIPESFEEFHLLGFLGGRRDHELFNLGEVHRILNDRDAPGTARFDQALVGYSPGSWQFTHHGGFSVGVIEQALVTLRGDCRYRCERPTRFSPLSSLGLSNEAYGTILIETDGCVFVFLRQDRD